MHTELLTLVKEDFFARRKITIELILKEFQQHFETG